MYKYVVKNIGDDIARIRIAEKLYEFEPKQTSIILNDNHIDLCHNNLRIIAIQDSNVNYNQESNVNDENGRVLLLFGPYDEFHVFNRFNTSIPKIRETYKYDYIIAAVPYNFACIITNADKVICATNEYLSKTESQYPEVLDKMGFMERYDYGYNKSNLMKNALYYVSKKYKNFDTMLYSDDITFVLKEYMPYNSIIYKPEITDIAKNIIHDFKNIGNQLFSGYRILPFLKDKESIEKKYKELFNDKTYIVFTRNFRNKQPSIYNTKDYIKNNIIECINSGYKIVNLGFPLKSFDIQNENYIEINKNFTYSELLCLCYLANATFLIANAGGFSTHVCTQLNLIFLTDEWWENDLFYNIRTNIDNLYTKKIKGTMLQSIKEFESLNFNNTKDYISDKKVNILI